MGLVGASLELPHPADRVYRVASRVDTLPEWLPEVTAASLLDAPLAAGSRVSLRLGPAGRGAEVVGRVTEFRPPTLLGITGEGGPLRVVVRTTLAAAGDRTRVGVTIDVKAAPLVGFVAREAERRINAELPAALERLRALVDAEPA